MDILHILFVFLRPSVLRSDGWMRQERGREVVEEKKKCKAGL